MPCGYKVDMCYCWDYVRRAAISLTPCSVLQFLFQFIEREDVNGVHSNSAKVDRLLIYNKVVGDKDICFLDHAAVMQLFGF